jgi:2-alkenal reductase
MWLVLLVPVLALACGVTIPTGDLDLPSVGQEEPTERVERLPAQEPAQPVNDLPTPTVGPTPTALPVPDEITDQETLLTNLYGRVNPSVVNITTFSSQGGQLAPLSQGSGFVYDTNGHIVTNAHVIHGVDEVEVNFADSTARIAEVIGEDLNSDLAVVRVNPLPEGIGPLPLADMSTLAVGQSVIAIGNPFGLEGTLTQGVISALGRSIPALTPFSIPQAIQTDAAINPGNSGGPLLNLNGEVIGVNAQIETGGESRSNSGVGFAIPVSIVQLVVPDLIETGRHAWTWLGISSPPGSMDPFLVQAMNLPVDRGVYISSVEPGGPADRAGLRGSNDQTSVDGHPVEVGGDVVTAIDGQPINSFEDLVTYLALNTAPGQEVTVTILRDGQSQEVQVTLDERPENAEEFNFPVPTAP